MAHESTIITNEVERFVSTGQRSIVDRYLSKAQTAEAQTAEAFFSTRLQETVTQLEIIMNTPKNSFTCPPLPLTRALNQDFDINASPILLRAEVANKVAEALLEKENANRYPNVIAVASAGEMAEPHLVKKKDYAVGIGVVFPLFDLKIHGQSNAPEQLLLQKIKNLQPLNSI